MTRRDFLLLVLVFAHPLTWAGLELPWLVAFGRNVLTENAVLLATGIEAVLFAGLAQRLSPPRHPRGADTPRQIEVSVGGFTVRDRPLGLATHVDRALLVTGSASAGIVLPAIAGLYVTLPAIHAATLVFLVVMGGVAFVFYGLITLVVNGLVAFERWRTQRPIELALEGRVLTLDGRSLALTGHQRVTAHRGALRVQDEDGVIEVRLEPHVAAWVAEQVRTIGPRGERSEVPAALMGVLER